MKIKSLLNIRNIPNFMIFGITYVLYFMALFITFRYSRLNQTLYYVIFGLLFILILLFGVVSIEGIVENRAKLRLSGLAVLTVISLLLFVTIFYVSRINSSLNNVIVNPSSDTEIKTAFVVYDTQKYADVNDINGLSLAILSNSENSDRNSFVKDEIESLGLNINYIEYLSYNDMLLGLFDGEVEVAALPSDYYNQFSDYEGYLDYLEKTKVVYEYTTKVANTQEQIDIDVTKEPFTLLIMGNDGGRTDSLILATYNPIKLSVTMTSIPRDSYVPIACYPNQQKDKIGHAFSVSRECALDTVSDLFDIDVNYYVEINFKGVVEIVDALDRVWLDSPVEFVGQNSDEERGHYTVWVPKGGFWATGEMALALARERYNMPGGDYQRQENQQQVIRSILDRTLELKDINKALNVLNAAGNNVKTNMSLNQMIAIFNGLTNAINKTSLDPEFMLDIIGSRVMGYSSYTYNDSLQLPLWILKPYENSLNDLRELMLSNLVKKELPSQVKTEFDSRLVFYEEDYFAKLYNEKEIHEQLPDFMPTMANNDWTLERAREWARSRAITLSVEEIRIGNALYNANVTHNYVIGQNVKYGIKTSSFNNLTIKVVKHELNCKLEENMQFEECKYKLPDFQDYGGEMTPISYVRAWFKDLGLNPSFKFVLILESESNYDNSKVGYVIKQDPVDWADVRTLGELTLTVMDPNYSIVMPDTLNWTETNAREWVKKNLELETNIEIKYEATTDSSLFGKVKTTSPTTGNKIKYQEILKITVYGESYTIGNYLNQTKKDVETSFCALNLSTCVFTNVETTDVSLIGKIASQTPIANTTKLKSEWAEMKVTFGVYVEKPVTTPVTTP